MANKTIPLLALLALAACALAGGTLAREAPTTTTPLGATGSATGWDSATSTIDLGALAMRCLCIQVQARSTGLGMN